MLQSLQACRALAAILVVLHHTNHSIFALDKYFGTTPLGRLVDFGYAAVDFFFVLSGFIVMYVHADDIGQPGRLLPYLWRRFSRVYLFYWVVLAAVLAVYLLSPSFGTAFQRDPDVIVRSIFLVPHPESHLVIVVAWTLVYEVLFYLIFGLLIVNRRLGTIVLVAWGAGALCSPYIEYYPWTFVFSHHHLRFLAGLAAAALIRRTEIPMPRVVALVGTAFFIGFGLIENFQGPLPPMYPNICFTLASAILIAGLAQADRAGLITWPRGLLNLGDTAYSVYLIHFMALSLIAKVCKGIGLEQYVPSLLLFALHVVGAIGIGCLAHYLVEHPIHLWTKQFFRFKEASEPIYAVMGVRVATSRFRLTNASDPGWIYCLPKGVSGDIPWPSKSS